MRNLKPIFFFWCVHLFSCSLNVSLLVCWNHLHPQIWCKSCIRWCPSRMVLSRLENLLPCGFFVESVRFQTRQGCIVNSQRDHTGAKQEMNLWINVKPAIKFILGAVCFIWVWYKNRLSVYSERSVLLISHSSCDAKFFPVQQYQHQYQEKNDLHNSTVLDWTWCPWSVEKHVEPWRIFVKRCFRLSDSSWIGLWRHNLAWTRFICWQIQTNSLIGPCKRSDVTLQGFWKVFESVRFYPCAFRCDACS